MDERREGYLRGNSVIWDGTHWRLPNGDDAEAVPLRCPRCIRWVSPGRPDPCIFVKGAIGACCGHGVHAGYVNWPGVSAPPDWWQRAFVGR